MAGEKKIWFRFSIQPQNPWKIVTILSKQTVSQSVWDLIACESESMTEEFIVDKIEASKTFARKWFIFNFFFFFFHPPGRRIVTFFSSLGTLSLVVILTYLVFHRQ